VNNAFSTAAIKKKLKYGSFTFDPAPRLALLLRGATREIGGNY
jgi:hypothetical protein